MTDPKIIVAIDTFDLTEAIAILDQLDPELCMVKIGSVVFNALGKSFLKHVSSQGFKIFLDLKFHDIPNTVYESVRSAADLGVWMVNVHISGGRAMMEKAKEAGFTLDPDATAKEYGYKSFKVFSKEYLAAHDIDPKDITVEEVKEFLLKS